MVSQASHSLRHPVDDQLNSLNGWVGGRVGKSGRRWQCDGAPKGRKQSLGEVTGPLLEQSSPVSLAVPNPPATLPGVQLTSVGILEWLSRAKSFTKRTSLGFFTKGLSIIVARPMNLGR